MLQDTHHAGWVIALTFIIALMLTAMPLPDWAVNWRPAWVALVLIYWCLALPERVGIGVGWLLGLLLDVQTGALLGQHACMLSVLAYVIIVSHRRIRVFPLVKQAVLIGVYIVLLQFFTLWVRGMVGIAPDHWTFWMPAITSMGLWPWVFILLRDTRRRFRVF